MNYIQITKRFLRQSPIIIVIFLVVALLMISSALIELQQSKKELYRLMREESHSLLQSLIVSSHNILNANEQIELLNRRNLLNNASHIKILYEDGRITHEILQKISKQNKNKGILPLSTLGENRAAIFLFWDETPFVKRVLNQL